MTATPTRVEPRGGRAVAAFGFVLGLAMSGAANLLGVRVPPAGVASSWAPPVADEAFSALFPVVLLVAVETMIRVRWPSTVAWTTARSGGVGLVAVVAAAISYVHVVTLTESWAWPPPLALVTPFGLDGLMLVCGLALLAEGRHARPVSASTETPVPLPRPAEAETAERRDGTEPSGTVVTRDSPSLVDSGTEQDHRDETAPSPETAAAPGETVSRGTPPPSPPGAAVSTPVSRPVKSNVVPLGTGRGNRNKMWADLDADPSLADSKGAGTTLDRRYGTRDYGRRVVRDWRAARDRREA